jgi:hypothetical protein
MRSQATLLERRLPSGAATILHGRKSGRNHQQIVHRIENPILDVGILDIKDLDNLYTFFQSPH